MSNFEGSNGTEKPDAKLARMGMNIEEKNELHFLKGLKELIVNQRQILNDVIRDSPSRDEYIQGLQSALDANEKEYLERARSFTHTLKEYKDREARLRKLND